jgi:hypothetical protein
MADTFDMTLTIALTIGGWIVATLVTVWSVRSAHRKDLEDQRAHEDTLLVFRPLRKEMEAISADEHQMSWGGILWSPSEEYRDMMHRGLLRPPRHDILRHEIEVLEDLHRKHSSRYTEFYNARMEAIRGVLQKAEVQLVGGAKQPLVAVVQVGPEDNQLFTSLAGDSLAGDRQKWLDRFKQLQTDAGNRGTTADWRTLVPTPGEMFSEAMASTSDSRAAYQGAANALLEQAKKIRGFVDLAIQEAA